MTENVMWLPEPASADAEQDEGDAEDEPPEDSWEALRAAEKLRDVLCCLRTRHAYCLFCGCEARRLPGC